MGDEFVPREDVPAVWLATFERDREFSEALIATQGTRIARMLVYARWCHGYMNSVQEDLGAMCRLRFSLDHASTARFWTLATTGGIFRDVCMVPYLVTRGLLAEAGRALRRSMENVGFLSHLWSDPSTASYLAEPEAQEFRKAFSWEADKGRRAQLRKGGIQKRFECCVMAKPLSDLYDIYSKYTVHGGSPNQLVRSELQPTRFSDMLVNRPDPALQDLSSDLELLGNGCEMLLLEVVSIHGTFGKRYGVTPSKGGEGGFYFTQLLEPGPDSEMVRATAATLSDLGWPESAAHS